MSLFTPKLNHPFTPPVPEIQYSTLLPPDRVICLIETWSHRATAPITSRSINEGRRWTSSDVRERRFCASPCIYRRSYTVRFPIQFSCYYILSLISPLVLEICWLWEQDIALVQGATPKGESTDLCTPRTVHPIKRSDILLLYFVFYYPNPQLSKKYLLYG